MSAIPSAPPASPPAEPRWQRRKEARPAEVLTAALEIFTERGFAGARLDDIAARAGVSKGTLYLYYTNKEELFKAVVRENILPAVAAAENLAATKDVAATRLLEWLMRGWFERLGDSKTSAIPKLIIAEAGNFPELARFYDSEVVARFRRAHRLILERGIATGEFRALPIEEALMIMAAPMMMMAMWRHAILPHLARAPQIDPQRFLETHIDMVLAALRPVSAMRRPALRATASAPRKPARKKVKAA
jgi:AcrR family transcriptional regulator